MSNDLNLWQGIGRLGKDVEMRTMPSGGQVANFSIACGSKYKNKQGEQVEETEWVNISAFGKLAEIMGQYLEKGSQVYISGRMKTDKYDKNGVTMYSTKIIADKLQMLGGKSDKPASSQPARPAEQPAASVPDNDPFSDDIPFRSLQNTNCY